MHPSASTPLLGTSLHRSHPNESTIDIRETPTPNQTHHTLQQPHSASFHLIPRLRQLILELKPYNVLWLAALSVLESIIVSQVGKVAGSFYQIIVDEQPAALLYAMIHAAVLYLACSAISTASVYLSGIFSLRWRRHLATVIHRDLCTNQAFIALPSTIDNSDQRSTIEIALLCDALGSLARLIAGVPFRIVYYSFLAYKYIGFVGICASYAFFCFGAWLQRTTAVPLAHTTATQEKKEGNLRFAHMRLREYGHEIAAYHGGRAELVHLNSTLSNVLHNQSKVVLLKAAMTATTRITEYSGALLNYVLVAAAMFAGAASTTTHGDDPSGGEKAQFVSNASFFTLSLIYSLTEVLDVADTASTVAALMMRTSEMFEVLKSTMSNNTKQQQGGDDNGGFVSHMNNTNTMNTNRNNITMSHSGQSPPLSSSSLSSVELKPSQLASTLLPPTNFSFQGGKSMEISLHQLGIDLCNEVKDIFPNQLIINNNNTNTSTTNNNNNNHFNNSNNNILCCMIIQFAGNGTIDLSPDRSTATLDIASTEMDRLLDIFLEFEHAVNAMLLSKGYWCNAVDPRTGMALHGKQGGRWSEVAAAHALLRYDTQDSGMCPLLVHPVYGTSAYPVSLFTNAPRDDFLFVLSSISDGTVSWDLSATTTTSSSDGQHRDSGQQQLDVDPSDCYVSIHNLSIATPDSSRLLVNSLSLFIHPQHHVLITGANGAGKSTLLRTLCYLHPLLSGSFTWNSNSMRNTTTINTTINNTNTILDDPSCVMYIPQRSLLAPGNTLRQQLTYPLSTTTTNNNTINTINNTSNRIVLYDASMYIDVLHRVGLSSLLSRCLNNIDIPLNITNNNTNNTTITNQYNTTENDNTIDMSCLSPGELQRLAIARVLLHRPKVVLLDEATSSMSEEASMQLYNEMHRAGVTCVSIAQECDSMKSIHNVQLKIGDGNDGGWSVCEL